MLAVFRRHLNSWVARAFFMLLVGTFVIWGVGTGVTDIIGRLLNGDGSVASVAGRKIELPEVQDAYRRQLAQVMRMFGGKMETTPQIRRGVAAQAIEQLVTQTAVSAAVSDLGLAVPDAALRQEVFAMPAFRGANGQFDRATFEQLLRSNGFTEQRFLAVMRQEIGQRQLMEAVRAGVISPDILTREVYAFQQEKRVADMVSLPFAAAPAPPAPTEAQLTRWYDNHKDNYTTPEYRKIKAVVLDPAIVGKDIPVADEDLKAAYGQHTAEYQRPEKRSLQVLLTDDEAKAKEMAAQWVLGEPPAKPVELNDATRVEIPAPELADAAFAAPEGVVGAPVHSALGWHVFKVTKVTPGVDRTLDDVREELRARIVADKAADLIYERAGKIEDMLAGGTALDDLPTDLGLAAVTGTLDARGLTLEGQRAPIPGSDALVNALVQAAFGLKKGDPPRLVEAPKGDEGGSGGYFAVVVEEVTQPAPRPYAQVAASVQADWTRDAVHHEQDEAAAGILSAVKAGKTLAEAAGGREIRRLPPVGRASGAEGVPSQLIDPLFALKPGEPTMVETPEGFVVAVLADIQTAEPNTDPIGFGRTRDGLAKALADDTQSVLTLALRNRGNPKVNAGMIDSIATPE